MPGAISQAAGPGCARLPTATSPREQERAPHSPRVDCCPSDISLCWSPAPPVTCSERDVTLKDSSTFNPAAFSPVPILSSHRAARGYRSRSPRSAVPRNGIYSTTGDFRKMCSHKLENQDRSLSTFQLFSLKESSWK